MSKKHSLMTVTLNANVDVTWIHSLAAFVIVLFVYLDCGNLNYSAIN